MQLLVGIAAALAVALMVGKRAIAWASGQPIGAIKLEHVDGVPMEERTAAAFRRLQAAARDAGVSLEPTSGFREHADQVRLYEDYIAGRRADVAARPGYSNHQRGTAVDIAVGRSWSSPASLWLASNARRFGWRATVSSEPWHWEYFG